MRIFEKESAKRSQHCKRKNKIHSFAYFIWSFLLQKYGGPFSDYPSFIRSCPTSLRRLLAFEYLLRSFFLTPARNVLLLLILLKCQVGLVLIKNCYTLSGEHCVQNRPNENALRAYNRNKREPSITLLELFSAMSSGIQAICSRK